MSRKRLIVAFIFVAFLCPTFGPTFGEDAKSVPVQKLIDQLSHKQFSQREKAYKLLQLRGPSAIPELKKALNHPDEEIRTRAEKLIPILEQMAALEPKRVTLKVEQEPLANILQQIEKQTGYKIEVKPKKEAKRYSFEMKDNTFWEAFEQIRKETGETLSLVLFGGEFEPKPIETRCRFISNHGLFRVEANAIQEDRYFNYDEPSKEESLQLANRRFHMSFGILAEPKCRILSRGEAVFKTVLDDHQKPFSIVSPKDLSEPSVRSTNLLVKRGKHLDRIVQFPIFGVTLQSSTERPKSIRQLKGTIPVLVAIESKEVVVAENVMQSSGKKFRSGAATLEIMDVRIEDKGIIHVWLAIPRDEHNIHYYWFDRFHLVSSKGIRVKIHQPSGGMNGDSGCLINLIFNPTSLPKEDSGLKLVFEDWRITELEIPFEFKDLPLP